MKIILNLTLLLSVSAIVNCAQMSQHVNIEISGARSKKLFTPLMQAVNGNNFDELQEIIKKSTKDINAQDAHGNTAFHWAVMNENLEMIKFLSSIKEVDVNLADFKNVSPLETAIRTKKIELISFLFNINKIITLNVKTPNWVTKDDITETIEESIKKLQVRDKYSFAAINKYNYMLKNRHPKASRKTQSNYILDEIESHKGAINLDIIGEDGFTVLEAAIKYRNFILANELIKLGARLRDNIGLSNDLKLFESSQLFVDDCDMPEYDNLLDDLMKQILSQDLKSKESQTISKVDSFKKELGQQLLSQIDFGDLDELSNLIKLGADLTATDDAGNNALHLAVINGSIELVQLLLTKKINKELKNESEQSALDLAKVMDNRAIIKLLGS